MFKKSFLEETSAHGNLSMHSNPFAKTSLRMTESIRAATTGGPNKDAEPKKSRQLIMSFVVVYTMIFFNGCCFTAVMPSVPFYLQHLHASPQFLGWVVSFYSLGQIFGSPSGGFLLSNDFLSSKHLLTITSTIGLLSSIVYAVAPGGYYILFSRLLTGISAGMEFTTELTFIAKNTTFQERTAFLASVTACNVVGFIMGPALGNILALLDINILGIEINQYTGPGWLLASMFLLDIYMVRTFFEEDALEFDQAANWAGPASERAGLLGNDDSEGLYGSVDIKEEEEEEEEEGDSGLAANNMPAGGSNVPQEPPPSLTVVLSLILVQFSLMCGWSLVETITSPLVQDEFDWDVREANLLFTCGGFVSLFVYVAFVLASKVTPDRWLVVTALVLCSVGFLMAVDWHELDWAPSTLSKLQPKFLISFLVGFALMNGGFMTGRSVTFALYSKLIAQEYQGKYLGWMVAAGSLARTLGPFAAVQLYYGMKESGSHLLVLFGSVGIFHIFCLLLVICQWRLLMPKSGNDPVSLRASLSIRENKFTPKGLDAMNKKVRYQTNGNGNPASERSLEV